MAYENLAQQFINNIKSSIQPTFTPQQQIQAGLGTLEKISQPYRKQKVYDITTKQYGATPTRLKLIEMTNNDNWKKVKRDYELAKSNLEMINNFNLKKAKQNYELAKSNLEMATPDAKKQAKQNYELAKNNLEMATPDAKKQARQNFKKAKRDLDKLVPSKDDLIMFMRNQGKTISGGTNGKTGEKKYDKTRLTYNQGRLNTMAKNFIERGMTLVEKIRPDNTIWDKNNFNKFYQNSLLTLISNMTNEDIVSGVGAKKLSNFNRAFLLNKTSINEKVDKAIKDLVLNRKEEYNQIPPEEQKRLYGAKGKDGYKNYLKKVYGKNFINNVIEQMSKNLKEKVFSKNKYLKDLSIEDIKPMYKNILINGIYGNKGLQQTIDTKVDKFIKNKGWWFRKTGGITSNE